MPNGVAVRLPCASKLDPASPSATELEIGEATAAAAVAIGQGIIDCTLGGGQLSAEAKMAGAEALTRVTMLQLAYFGGDSEFAEIAYREGKRALWKHPGFQGQDPARREHLFEVFLQGALEISARTAAVERALQTN
jgi:hypothetical protein